MGSFSGIVLGVRQKVGTPSVGLIHSHSNSGQNFVRQMVPARVRNHSANCPTSKVARLLGASSPPPEHRNFLRFAFLTASTNPFRWWLCRSFFFAEPVRVKAKVGGSYTATCQEEALSALLLACQVVAINEEQLNTRSPCSFFSPLFTTTPLVFQNRLLAMLSTKVSQSSCKLSKLMVRRPSEGAASQDAEPFDCLSLRPRCPEIAPATTSLAPPLLSTTMAPHRVPSLSLPPSLPPCPPPILALTSRFPLSG